MLSTTYKVLIITIIFYCVLSTASSVFGQSATPSPSVSPTPTSGSSDNSGEIQQLESQISQYQQKISDLQGQENSLSSAIKVIDNQVKVTELQVSETQAQIASLGKDIDVTKQKISGLDTNITSSTKTLVNHIAETYKVGREPAWQILLSSNDINNFLNRLKYLQIVQIYDKQQVYAAEQTKVNYGDEKQILTEKQDEAKALQDKLQKYTDQINEEKQSKQTLLSQTQGSEANYQKLLQQAQAQLAGFSSFVNSQGGASLLSGQTVCDDWGCYYNQRDSQWGGMALNGTQYSIASDGCLLTSMAMVYTHYGHKDVTPISINSNPGNFASYEHAYLLRTITANGTTSNRISASIDSTLSSGDPVIVGISYDGGPISDHFVVLVSGSGGNYIMNDPYTANGHKIPFTSHYSVGSIREIDRVSF